MYTCSYRTTNVVYKCVYISKYFVEPILNPKIMWILLCAPPHLETDLGLLTDWLTMVLVFISHDTCKHVTKTCWTHKNTDQILVSQIDRGQRKEHLSMSNNDAAKVHPVSMWFDICTTMQDLRVALMLLWLMSPICVCDVLLQADLCSVVDSGCGLAAH